MIDEAKGDVTNLLACLVKPDVSFSRDEVEQLTLDLVQTLTGKKFKSAVDAHANMCNDLKLKATFRPVLFLQVITSIISASNNSLQSIKVERTDVNLSLAFGTTDSDVGLFNDSFTHVHVSCYPFLRNISSSLKLLFSIKLRSLNLHQSG